MEGSDEVGEGDSAKNDEIKQEGGFKEDDEVKEGEEGNEADEMNEDEEVVEDEEEMRMPGMPSKPCPQCEERFTTQEGFLEHISTHSSTIFIYLFTIFS